MLCQKSQKVIHASKEAAIIARKRMNNPFLSAYKCPNCKGWHLGSKGFTAKKANKIDALLREHERKIGKKLKKG